MFKEVQENEAREIVEYFRATEKAWVSETPVPDVLSDEKAKPEVKARAEIDYVDSLLAKDTAQLTAAEKQFLHKGVVEWLRENR
jgi:hypothetical protein